MTDPRKRTGRIAVASALALCALALGPWISQCSAGSPADRSYVDEDYAFSLSVPKSWARVNPAGFAVPGEVCRTWSSGDEATIAVFIQKPQRTFTARFLLDQTAASMEKIGCKVLDQKVETISGYSAMRLVATGKGTGKTLDGKGRIPTTQEWIAIPRPKDILLLVLSAPEKDYAEANGPFQEAVKSMRIEKTPKK